MVGRFISNIIGITTALHGKEYNIQRCEAVAFENPRSTECCITSQQVWLQDFWIRSSLGQLARSRDGTCPGLQAPWSDTSGRGAAAERRPLLSTALLYGTMETSSSRAALISRQRGAFLGYKLSWDDVTCSHRNQSSPGTFSHSKCKVPISDFIFHFPFKENSY